MIETRGKDKTLVISGSAVPVLDICEAVIKNIDAEQIKEKFPVTTDEIFECLDIVVNDKRQRLHRVSDYIEFTFNDETKTFDVLKLSDMMYYNLIMFGKMYEDNVENFEILSAIGLRHVLLECLVDIAEGREDFKEITLHNIVFNSLNEAIDGRVEYSDLLNTLRQDLQIEYRDGELKVGTNSERQNS